MNGVKAIAAILAADATVSASVSDRITVLQRPEREGFPGIAIDLNGVVFNDNKDGGSSLDEYDITVGIYSEERDQAFLTLCEAVRTALDRTTGTYADVVVAGLQITDARMLDVVIADPIYICEQDYKLMVAI